MTIPTIARGVAKTLAFLPETTFGTVGTGTAQTLRRTQATINQSVQEIDSAEIIPSQQVRDARQGSRLVQGQISGQLSCLTYEKLFANLFRNSFASGVTRTMTDSVVTVTGSSSGAVVTISSPASNFLTVGFKMGDVVALTGCVSPVTANNNVNMLLTGVTATLLTAIVPSAGTMTAYSSGQTSVTVSVLGKKLIMPSSYATATIGSFSFESWFSDIAQSELATGCRMTSIGLSVPPSGFVNLTAGFTGQALTTFGTQQLTSPAAVTTTTSLTATQGYLMLFGAPIAYLTNFNLQISAAADAPAVVGSPLTPNIFLGTMMASGSITALFAADGITAAFLNETEFQIQLYLTDSSSASPNFISVFLPRVKIFADNKNDSDREITRSMTFKCLEQSVLGGTGTQFDDTTVTIQDNLAA